MSLINDALKRAKQAHEEKAPPQFQGAPLHTVPTPPPSQSSNQTVLLLMAGMMVIVLVGIVLVIFMWARPGRPSTVTASEPPPVATAAAPASAPAPVAQVTTPPKPAAASKPAEPIIAAAPAPVIPVTASPPGPEAQPQPMMPAVTLQGILYSPTKPAAIINGRSLFVGDHIGEVHVIAIHQQSATILWNGQTNELTMER